MKQIFLYFHLFCKRLLKKTFFLLLLCLLPLAAIFLKKAFTIDNLNIQVGLYTPDKEGISRQAVDTLLNQDDVITFIEYDSSKQLRASVAGGNCLCGYILPDHLEEKFDLNLYRNSIEVFTGSYSISPLTDEIVFSSVFREYALHILNEYIDKTGLFKSMSSKQIHTKLKELYEQYLMDGSTFSFQYHNEEAISKDSSVLLPGYLILSVRGLLSIVIFISGFAGAIQLYKDRYHHIFRTLSGIRLRLAEFMTVLAPVALTAASCLIGIIVSGSSGSLVKELVSLLFYTIATALYCYGLCLIFKKEISLCALIPVFIISSLIICPVFIDITEFNSNLTILQNLFAPTWYLRLF